MSSASRPWIKAVIIISHAEPNDARAILDLQKLAYQSEAKLYND